MSVLKSDFDIDQFTVNSVGPFPCHQFHFLMRQYSLTLLELQRLYNDRKRQEYIIQHCYGFVKSGDSPECVMEDARIAIEMLDLSIENKRQSVAQYEKVRLALIERHGGKSFTNQDYQDEEPAYWSDHFQRLMTNYRLQTLTGIPEGVWKNLQSANEEPILNSNNRLAMEAPVQKVIEQAKNELPALTYEGVNNVD